MKRTLAVLLALVLGLSLGGCIKQKSSIVINNDATGTIDMEAGYSVEALEAIAEFIESMGDHIGADMGEDPLEKLEQVETKFSEKELVKKMKEAGVEVTSAKTTEKDGWKLVSLKGKVKDVNSWIEFSEKEAEKARRSEEDEDGSAGLDGLASQMTSIRFYKTAREGIGEVVLIPPIDTDEMNMGPEGMDPEEMPEGMEEIMDAQLDAMKEKFSLNDMDLTVRVTLPGKIVSTKGCNKAPQEEKTVVFSFKGTQISFSGMKDFFGMKDGVSAEFEIPQGCKIKFEEKKAPKKAEKKTDKKKDDKKKKGGLGIDEDGE